MVKIYKIVDRTNGNVYVGKTTKEYLSERIASHKYDFERGHYCSSQIILKNNNWIYELIEETEDKTRERYWIENLDNCINKVIPLGNSKEWKKRWRDNNKEKIEQLTFQNRDKHNDYKRDLYHYKNSWGGDKRRNNNLLQIDVDLFTS